MAIFRKFEEHWNFRYAIDRVGNYFFEKRNKDLPWITPASIKLLDQLLTEGDVGMELGSGRSTPWLASRCKLLTSVEDHKGWFNTVKEMLGERQIDNVEYLFRENINDLGTDNPYLSCIKNADTQSLDFVFVDGKHRDLIALEAVTKIKKGGLLILDDSQRYIYKPTHAPHALTNKSQMTDKWAEFQKNTSDWRKIWTTNGVSDTTIYIKK